MKTFPRIFPYQLVHDDDLKEKCNDSFERGYRAGKRDAIDSLRSIQAYDCSTLTEDEKEMVMSFLIEHNLEFGYNLDAGGFYVIKQRKPNTFKIDIEEFNRKAKEILENEVIPQVEKYEQIKKNKLRELILSLEVRPMTRDEWENTRLNAYKPVK